MPEGRCFSSQINFAKLSTEFRALLQGFLYRFYYRPVAVALCETGFYMGRRYRLCAKSATVYACGLRCTPFFCATVYAWITRQADRLIHRKALPFMRSFDYFESRRICVGDGSNNNPLFPSLARNSGYTLVTLRRAASSLPLKLRRPFGLSA